MNTVKEKETKKKIKRTPVVVVMGHVDHGKTSLLDYIRKSRVAEKETGGITQHIGAYTIELTPPEGAGPTSKITFIDTPGHEAFTKMRSRGAVVADIGILVVAADEGVKPQTKEAIKILKSAGIPFVVAINKIDRPGKDIDRVKKELAENDVLLESWGGKIPSVEISAKTGERIPELLDLLLLVAELEELSGEEDSLAEGVVIESHRDSRRGDTATVLIRKGTLRRGQFVRIGNSVSAVKILEDFRGRATEEVSISLPARLAGLSQVPAVGAAVVAYTDKHAAKEAAQFLESEVSKKASDEPSAKIHINVILKADVSGSREAIEDVLATMQLHDIGVRLIRNEVGDINDSDLQLAMSSSNVVILGFRVKIPDYIRDQAAKANIALIQADIIYEIFDELKKAVAHLIPAEVREVPLGKLKVLKFFKQEKSKQIVGGRVIEGKLEAGALLRVWRKQVAQGKGRIVGLQSRTQAVNEVAEGNECGVLAEADMLIAENDVLEAYKEERVERSF